METLFLRELHSMFKVPNEYRVKYGQMASSDAEGCNGAFEIPLPKDYKKNRKGLFVVSKLMVIASDRLGWEHISVRKVTGNRNWIPIWSEMCFAKDVFWDAEDCVVQFHPPKSMYVDNYPFVLHLWRSTEFEFVLPPKAMI